MCEKRMEVWTKPIGNRECICQIWYFLTLDLHFLLLENWLLRCTFQQMLVGMNQPMRWKHQSFLLSGKSWTRICTPQCRLVTLQADIYWMLAWQLLSIIRKRLSPASRKGREWSQPIQFPGLLYWSPWWCSYCQTPCPHYKMSPARMHDFALLGCHLVTTRYFRS